MLDVADKHDHRDHLPRARRRRIWSPEARLVIDIGGQDSKVIAIDPNGLVAQFAMNDRCAAGTGKFLEMLARAMESGSTRWAPLALQAKQKLKSPACARPSPRPK